MLHRWHCLGFCLSKVIRGQSRLWLAWSQFHRCLFVISFERQHRKGLWGVDEVCSSLLAQRKARFIQCYSDRR
jgi:hypothetical protein